MLTARYRQIGTIREKYNVVNRTTKANVIGYHENVVGFGWTNGTFLVLLHGLPKASSRQFCKARSLRQPQRIDPGFRPRPIFGRFHMRNRASRKISELPPPLGRNC